MPPKLIKQIVTIAGCAVLLGIAAEIALIIVSSIMRGGETPNAFIADCAQKLTWSTIVCAGTAVGLAAAKLRPAAMGVAGMISGPAAFQIAKAVHKSAKDALQAGAIAPFGAPSAAQIAGIRAVEYAVLGLLIGLISRRAASGLRHFAAAGLGVGLVFGGMVLGIMHAQSPSPSLYTSVSRGVNEVGFPIGCSVVLWAATALANRPATESKAA